jgi:hypothetical protein
MNVIVAEGRSALRLGCLRLARRSFTFAATSRQFGIRKMPAACTQEPHVCSYTAAVRNSKDALGLPAGASRLQLHHGSSEFERCLRLARRSLTFAATSGRSSEREALADKPQTSRRIATPRCSSKREPLPDKPAACAPESASSQRGESPLQVNALRPVTKCNCDAAMRGGEQQEVNNQSVG